MENKIFGIIIQIKKFENYNLIKLITNKNEIISAYTKDHNLDIGILVNGNLSKNFITIDLERKYIFNNFNNEQKKTALKILNSTNQLKSNMKEKNIFNFVEKIFKLILINESQALFEWNKFLSN